MTKQKPTIQANGTLYDYEYYPQSGCTVVAIEASLEDFKAQPVMIDGKPMQYFKERTVKDCRNIDGCVYLHLGHMQDDKLCELIERFQKAKKEVKDWKPKGRLVVRDNTIKI